MSPLLITAAIVAVVSTLLLLAYWVEGGRR